MSLIAVPRMGDAACLETTKEWSLTRRHGRTHLHSKGVVMTSKSKKSWLPRFDLREYLLPAILLIDIAIWSHNAGLLTSA
jgi:hypothetical protein